MSVVSRIFSIPRAHINAIKLSKLGESVLLSILMDLANATPAYLVIVTRFANPAYLKGLA